MQLGRHSRQQTEHKQKHCPQQRSRRRTRLIEMAGKCSCCSILFISVEQKNAVILETINKTLGKDAYLQEVINDVGANPHLLFQYTRVVLKLGNVSLTSTTGATDAAFQVKITFDSIMIKTNVAVPHNSKHWVSAGAEFNNEKEIWIGSVRKILI